MSGRTPKLPCCGAQRVEVRNSTGETSKKNRTVSSKRTTTIPTVVKIDRYAQAVSRSFITRSRVSLVRLLRFQTFGPDLVLPASTATENPPKPRDQKSGRRPPCRPPYATSRRVPAHAVTATAGEPTRGRRLSAH